MERPRKLVFGLGNPGPEYEDTRHNVGFRVLDHLAGDVGSLFESARHLDASYRGPKKFRHARLFDSNALLVKPETWMNLSGTVVRPLADWAGVAPQDILVVYDDLDLPVAALRIRPHGGAGGQKGMRSIIDELETDRFPRLRVGIGRSTDAARHVLSAFSPAEETEIEISIAEASEAITDWLLHGDIEGTMTRFHSRWNP